MQLKPNHLTLARLILVPGMLAALWIGSKSALVVCTLLFLLGEVTDIADGRWARYTGSVSEIGKLFDPMVDCMMRLTLFAVFLAYGWMPAWMFLPILWREVVVIYGRSMHATFNGKALAARGSGKYVKAVPQFLAILVTIIVHIFGLDTRIAWCFQLVAMIGTTVSGIDYAVALWKANKGKI